MRVTPSGEGITHAVMLRVHDVVSACRRARELGAVIVAEPQEPPFGERRCMFADPWGHRWTHDIQTLRDVAPDEWGGASVAPRGVTRFG
jgi:uncharacterized glyoxalase superfamily protein PhnB